MATNRMLTSCTQPRTTDTPDIERASGSTSVIDPFQFRDGLIPDEELDGLRRRKQHKPVAKYQGKQNEVCLKGVLSEIRLTNGGHALQLIISLLKPMEEHTEDARVEEEAHRLPVSQQFQRLRSIS